MSLPTLEQASDGLLETQEQPAWGEEEELLNAPGDSGGRAGLAEADMMLAEEAPGVSALAQVITTYEHTIGPATPEIAEAIDDWLSRGCDPCLLCRYIEEAHACNIPTWASINAVIKGNVGKNIWTLEQYDALKRARYSAASIRSALSLVPLAEVVGPETKYATKTNQAEVAKEFQRQFQRCFTSAKGH